MLHLLAILPSLDALIYLFNALAGFNTFLIILILLRHSRGHAPSTSFLIIFLLGMFFVNLTTALIQSSYILYVPWLFRLPSPLYYAMFPAVFLYLTMTLSDRERIRKREWLHFLPAALHFFEYLPFYFSSRENKVQHILETIKNPLGVYAHDEGIFPPYVHNILRATQGLIYGLLMCYLVYKDLRSGHSRLDRFYGVKQWLIRLSVIVVLFSLSIFLTFIGGWATAPLRSLHLSFWSALALTVCSLSLFHNPLLLYGMPRLSRLMHDMEPEPAGKEMIAGVGGAEQASMRSDTLGGLMPAEIPSNGNGEKAGQDHEPEWLTRYTQMVEQYKQGSTSYLHQKFSIRDMSMELDIPQHHLSYILNRVYNLRFNDFINELRILYIRKRTEKEDALRDMTLEGLAHEAGFTSRVTFIRAVQRLTGMNPSDYFKHLSAD